LGFDYHFGEPIMVRFVLEVIPRGGLNGMMTRRYRGVNGPLFWIAPVV